MAPAILSAENLTRTYATAAGVVTVLQDVSFSLPPGTVCAITGPSGSGKTTLLGLCAGLDLPTSGRVILEGHDLSRLNEDQRAALRRTRTGFIFQNFQLLPSLTALENVMVPMELSGKKSSRGAALDLLERVGLSSRSHHLPIQLSGGEQQRVALARAFIHQPAVLFADEPTGNLDAVSRETVEDMLFTLNREAGTTLIIVTHDIQFASRTSRVIRMAGGRLLAGAAATHSAAVS